MPVSSGTGLEASSRSHKIILQTVQQANGMGQDISRDIVERSDLEVSLISFSRMLMLNSEVKHEGKRDELGWNREERGWNLE